MSVTPDNDAERDASLTAIYRAAGQDVPPLALDSAILAAARREVGARPRPAGFTFGRSWHVPVSIAAVVVLSVSLVMLMREEAPELVAPPRADTTVAESAPAPAVAGRTAENVAADNRGFVRDEPRSKTLGLKPPQALSPSGLGMRQPEFAAQSPPAKKDSMVDRPAADTAGATVLEKRRAAPAEAYREDIAQSPAAAPRRSEQSLSAPASEPFVSAAPPSVAASPAVIASAENKVAKPQTVPPALAAPQARSAPSAVAGKLELQADLPPEKWLERIEELRKRGRLDEAKLSLAEFRKRFPDYKLPESLREWVAP
jgi:resuscitation-promoting factor RpfA